MSSNVSGVQSSSAAQVAAVQQGGNNNQVQLTASWEEPLDKVGEVLKKGIKENADLIAAAATAPCGTPGQCVKPIVAEGIKAGADCAVDNGCTAVKATVKCANDCFDS